jgi:cell division protein FtsB
LRRCAPEAGAANTQERALLGPNKKNSMTTITMQSTRSERRSGTGAAETGHDRGRRGAARRLVLVMVLLGLLVAVAVAANYGPVRHYLDARARADRAAAEVAALQERTTHLQAQLGKLSEAGYLEDLARQQLSYTLPGEELYVVTDDTGTAEGAAAGAGESQAAGELAGAGTVTDAAAGEDESFVTGDASFEEIAGVVTEIVADRLGAALAPGVITTPATAAADLEEQFGEAVGSAAAEASAAAAEVSSAVGDAASGAMAAVKPGLFERILLAVASLF